jgi:polyether ionophore transport system permease protein
MPVAFALRLGRWGVLGFSAAAFFAATVNAFGFYAIAGDTPAARAGFGQSMITLASQFVALLPPPIRPDTIAGYMQWRAFNPLVILFSVWALASASGFARGDEEKGMVEAVLATGVSRAQLIASRVGAFAVGLAVAAGALGLVAGAASGHESVGAPALVEVCAMVAAVALASYAISLLIAQLVTGRVAAAAAGTILLGLYLLNGLSRVYPSLSGWRWLSPFRYYDLSQPLPPGGYFDGRALWALLGIAVVAGAAAALAFQGRDLGSSLVAAPVRPRTPGHLVGNPAWLRHPVVRGLHERRLGILAWAAGLVVLALVFVSLTRTIVQVLLSVPALLPYFSSFISRQVYPAVLGFTWFNVAQLLFAGLAVAYVARWAAEDADGRLEATLSQPFSRAAVVVERMAVLAAGAAVIAAAGGVTLYVAAHAQGIELNPGRLLAACAMLVPFALVFAGAGALLSAWNPRAAVSLLGAYAFASYLDAELGAIFKLPPWLQDLSAFTLFGTPLLAGVDLRNMTLMLLLAAAGLGGSILAMQRRDVGA